MRKIAIALVGVCLLVVGLSLHYVLPRVSVVEVVGAEVKRIDEGNRTRDVYMIQAQRPDGGGVRVFRNEDAWFYLKLNSANLQARAQAFAQSDEVETVAIRHYGWRIPIFSMFQNAIKAWPVEPDYRHIPIFNIAVIALLLAGAALAWFKMRRVFARVAEGRARRAEKRTRAERAVRTVSTGADNDHEDWLRRDQRAPGPSDTSGKGE